MKIAIYPGTFDPITNGHLDILERALTLFDKVILTIARNSAKDPLFSEEERMELIRKATAKYTSVEVDSFHGLLVDYVLKRKAIAIVRGLRAMTDFEFEMQMALMNRKIGKKVETIFLMPNEKFTYLSSNIVREIARLGGDVGAFVPPVVKRALIAKNIRQRKAGR